MEQQIRRIYNPLEKLAMGANTVGTLVIFVLVAILNIDVVARGIFHAPLKGAVEVVVFSLILIVFLQLPDVVRSNRLTRSDGFLILAEIKFPKFGNALSCTIDIAACIFMALIAWTTWPEFIDSIGSCSFFTQPEFAAPATGNFIADLKIAFGRCEYFGTPGIFTAPWWPAKLAIAFSVTLCSFIFFFKAILGHQNPPHFEAEEGTL